VITVVPRLWITLKGDWDGTHVTLPEGRWLNQLTNEEIRGGQVKLATLLALFPVALLTRAN